MGRQWSNHVNERPRPEGVKLKGEAMPTYVRSVSGDTRVSEPCGGFDPLNDQECYGAEKSASKRLLRRLCCQYDNNQSPHYLSGESLVDRSKTGSGDGGNDM